ncbi:MAG: HAD family phosphatase [Agathobacter sp.]|nr:HAD family phosphatase [Agathobacter sp.]
MKEIKLIALDLDGTLFNKDGIITPMTKAELNRAAAQGVKIVISTGRPFNGLPFDQIKDTAIEYALTTNGASIYRIDGKECLHEDGMDIATVKPIMDWILAREIHIDIYTDGVGFTPIRCRENIGRLDVPESLRNYMIATRTTVEDLMAYVNDCGKKIQKINLNFYPQPDGTFLHRDETLRFLKANPEIEVVCGGFNNFEISKAGVTKREGLAILASYLGTDLEHTMAMGDSENDFSMINAAGVGVAMGNASDDIKAIADYITTSNNEDGVGAAIRNFIPTL